MEILTHMLELAAKELTEAWRDWEHGQGNHPTKRLVDAIVLLTKLVEGEE